MARIPYQGGASIDENGHATGGKPGDQKDEVRRRPWYIHSKGWYIYRAKDPRIGPLVAYAMERSVANQHIGYNQYKRYTLYNQVKPLGYDPGLATIDCDCDCSTDVFVCLCYAFNQIGIKFDELVVLRSDTLGDFRTGNMGARMMATGLFIKFTDDKHCKRADGAYLRKGDIAVTRKSGHTIALLEDGELAYADETTTTPVTTVKNPYTEPTDKEIVKMGFRIKNKVKWVQWHLKRLGYDLGAAGVDGDFGPKTDAAVRSFQKKVGIEVDGEVWKVTRGKLKEAK